ncbi:MAG: hypothetical protein IPL97_08475 [Niastella sp.]|nr:hypothetical protein [Niastella sp.]
MAQVTPGSVLLRIEGKFDPKTLQSFSEELKGTVNAAGQTTIFRVKNNKRA